MRIARTLLRSLMLLLPVALAALMSAAIPPVEAQPLAQASPTLQLTGTLIIQPGAPFTGQIVTAGFKVKNVGGQSVTMQEVTAGARLGADWSGTAVDFPHVWNVTLQPGQEYSYQKQRTFTTLGNYFAEPRVKVGNVWMAVAGGNRVDFTVGPKPPGKLQVVEPLTLTPPSPYIGEMVKARVKIQNVGGQPVSVQELAIVVRNKATDSAHDFTHVGSFTLQPNSPYPLEKQQAFPFEGEYYAELRARIGGVWAPVEGGNRVDFKVAHPLQLTDPLKLSTTTPWVGEQVQATFRVKNVSTKSIYIQEIGVEGSLNTSAAVVPFRYPSDTGVTLMPGAEHPYGKPYAFTSAGQGQARPAAKINGNWVNIPGSNGVDFTVKDPVAGECYMDFSNYLPYQNESIAAGFTLNNMGNQPILLQEVTAAVRQGTSWSGSALDFPHVFNVTVQPGQPYHYEKSRSFSALGQHEMQPMIKVNGSWRFLDGPSRMDFMVEPKPSAVNAVIPVNGPIGPMAVNPSTNRLYVATGHYRFPTVFQVTVINGATNSVLATIALSEAANGIAVNPSTNRVYVATDAQLYVINGATNSVITTIPTGYANRVVVNPSTNRVYVTQEPGLALDSTRNRIYASASSVTVIDGATNTVAANIALATNNISVIDGNSNAVIDTITTIGSTGSLAVNPATNRLYAADSEDDLSVINLNDKSLVRRVAIDGGVDWVALNPSRNQLFVIGMAPDAGVVTVVDGATNNIKTTVKRKDYLGGAACNPTTNRTYVSSFENRAILVITVY